MTKEEKKRRFKLMMTITDVNSFHELLIAITRYERKEKIKKIYENKQL